jgi:multidrug efflux system outer membrane protein
VKRTIAGSILTILTFGCTVGPDYKRPKVEVPGAYRTPAPAAAPAADPSRTDGRSEPAPDGQPPQTAAAPFGDQKWWDVFHDPQLQQLIRAAVQQNYDVRIAATRILQAQAVLGITRADQLPTVNAGASGTNDRFPQQKLAPAYEDSATSVNASVVWALDFWGKYRRATEAARASLLATEWARRAVISTLVSNVAASYFQLRSDDLQLEIARRTLASRRESLALTRTLQEGGVGTLLDVRQAEQLVAVAAESIPELERRIQLQENFISTLLGNNPGPVDRGMTLTDQPLLPDVPSGLPSRLLERRPDIRAVEAQLVAANARIGVAKSAYFPDITLTAVGGFRSAALSSLFTSASGFWSLGGSLVQPIFTGGRIRSGVRLTEARKEELVLTYQQTIQQAFLGVSDALISYQKNREFRQHQEELLTAARDAARLSDDRYRGGAASYLEVLTNETNAFNAELGLTQARLNELVSLVDIYRNLGGGWDQ